MRFPGREIVFATLLVINDLLGWGGWEFPLDAHWAPIGFLLHFLLCWVGWAWGEVRWGRAKKSMRLGWFCFVFHYWVSCLKMLICFTHVSVYLFLNFDLGGRPAD